MNLLNSNKGSLGKGIVVATAFLFAFGFLSILGWTFTNAFVGEFGNTTYSTPETEAVGAQFLWGIGLFDWVIVIAMVMFILGIGIANWKIASPPAFFIVQFVLGIFYGALSYFFNYMFQEIAGNTVFDGARVFFPNTLLICTNLHWIGLAMLVVGTLTLFGKGQADKGQFVE